MAQECPQSAQGADHPAAPRTLEGKLVFHDGIRKWFELVLDKPQCGQAAVQLVSLKGNLKAFEVLRGCQVTSSGALDFSPTGYYSLDVYQDVREIKASGACALQPPFPDYSKVKPANSVQTYRVDMHVVTEGEKPIEFRISSQGKEIHPWQAYANYMLTGSFILYGFCADGFVVDTVFGTPEAKPSHFDEPRTKNDWAAFDTENATSSGKTDLQLGYTCVHDQPGR